MNDLSIAKECSDAVAYASSFNSNATYRRTGSRYNAPRGCFMNDDGDMFFNSDYIGEIESNTMSICKGTANIPL